MMARLWRPRSGWHWYVTLLIDNRPLDGVAFKHPIMIASAQREGASAMREPQQPDQSQRKADCLMCCCDALGCPTLTNVAVHE